MTQNRDPYENAIAEHINGILKYEFLIVDGFNDQQQAVDVIKEIVKIYNGERPHLSYDGMLTPIQAHQQNKMTVKTWKKKPRKPMALGVK